MASVRTRGLGAQHQQRRRDIADAVLAVVAERGLAAVSLSQVAATAGVSPGRVQHYFPSKTELLTTAFERGNELSSARIRERVGPDLDSADPREVVTAVLTELIPDDPASLAHLRVRQSFAALALSDDTIAARLRDDYARLHQTLARLLRRDQAAARVSASVRPDDAAVRLVALAEGLAYYVLIGVTPPADARAQLREAMAQLYRRRIPALIGHSTVGAVPVAGAAPGGLP